MRYQRIVVPLDGSLLSEYVFPEVERMALAFQSQLTFLHIVPSEEGAGREPTPSQKRARADIIEYLEDLQKDFELRGVRTRWTIRCGDPTEEIVWFVDQHESDMVIMSTHGNREPGQEHMASVEVEVLKRVQVPVVLVGVPTHVARL